MGLARNCCSEPHLALPVREGSPDMWVRVAQVHYGRSAGVLQAAHSQQQPCQAGGSFRVPKAGFIGHQLQWAPLVNIPHWAPFNPEALPQGTHFNGIPEGGAGAMHRDSPHIGGLQLA